MKLFASLHDELTAGQRKLITTFGTSSPRIIKSGEVIETTIGQSNGILHLRTGWACQCLDLPDSRQAIVDVYLPGDVIGLDTLLRTRPLKNVLMLTCVTAEVIPAQDLMTELMANRPTALFIAWLLGERQRRADRLLAAISGLDARGRIATMVLDFHARLRRRKLISGLTYSLPLTQVQIGQYLGLTVVHVNRVLRALRADRVLELERHCVTILDLDRLTSWAEDGRTGSPNAGGGSKTGLSDCRSDEAAA